jgi:four helix bundle protein
MRADSNALFERLQRYSIRIVRLTSALPTSSAGRWFAWQLLKSGTSPGAHYGEARRAKSTADFISKIEGGLQELDESQYWLSLIEKCCMLPSGRLESLMAETNELISIFVSIARNARKNKLHPTLREPH